MEDFRDRFEKFVGVERPPTLVVSTFNASEFVATRVQWRREGESHPTLFDRADGYMLCVQRLDVGAQPYWVDQRPLHLSAMQRGQFLLLDLNLQHSSLVPSDVDCISIYMSRATLRQFQEEHDFPATGQLRTPLAMVHEDIVVRNLGETLLPAIAQQDKASRLYASHVSLAFLTRLTQLHGIHSIPSTHAKGRLAPWQEKRAKDVLMSHLDGRTTLEQLAHECRLSRAHFARAFKTTVGMSPLHWLNTKRLERARMLLLNTNLSLEQISSSCGYVDSSHFTRSFQKVEGLPPGTWRRLRRG